MKTLYIDCSMGAAGDMLMAGLYELLSEAEQNAFLDKMNSLGIPGVHICCEKKETCGIVGSHMHVTVHGEEEDCGHHHHHDHDHDHHHHHHDHDHDHAHHHHNGYNDIKALIAGLPVSDRVKYHALQVYGFIAQAESRVHGKEMDEIHFHEVGTLDAVADVVGNCLLMEMLGSPRVTASPVHVGSGTVKCAHGVLPVPAPATALILKDIPIYAGDIKGELCTPTGAALLRHFVEEFGPMPQMTTDGIGYGVGTKEFSQANCVRIMAGEPAEDAASDDVIELAANIDDMTAEEIGFAIEILMEKGALDVYGQPIIMKKSRPAVKLTCMCRPEDKEKFTELLFKHTTTIGLREYRCARTMLERTIEAAETPWGEVNVKRSSGSTERIKAEFDDLARIARENDMSILDIKKEIHDK